MTALHYPLKAPGDQLNPLLQVLYKLLFNLRYSSCPILAFSGLCHCLMIAVNLQSCNTASPGPSTVAYYPKDYASFSLWTNVG